MAWGGMNWPRPKYRPTPEYKLAWFIIYPGILRPGYILACYTCGDEDIVVITLSKQRILHDRFGEHLHINMFWSYNDILDDNETRAVTATTNKVINQRRLIKPVKQLQHIR